MEKWWLSFLFFLVFLIPLVYATNGCCGETISGDTCVYAPEEDCATPNYFDNAPCESVSWCGTGCCVKIDGGCAEGAGEYSCVVVEGGDYSDKQLCSTQSSCDEVCCQIDSDYEYITRAECDNWEIESGIVSVEHPVSSASACDSLEREQESGCCVTQSECVQSSGGDCGTTNFDASTGYGFYMNENCADISGELKDNDLEAAEICDCTVSIEDYTCASDGIRVLEGDSCGNVGDVVEECNYSEEVCSETSGGARCVSASCYDTYSFASRRGFELYNSYKVYYEENGEWKTIDLNLGDTRKNGESWCIYESPVGSFRDRVGSQHYSATCGAGEELIENCVSDRSEICVTTYNPLIGQFKGECVPNNFDSFYGVPYYDDLTETYLNNGNLYTEGKYVGLVDSPVSDDEEVVTTGVSTVTRATSDYCEYANLKCETLYGDTAPGDNDGWEIYANAYCLRKTFSLLAADYCGSRGNCGLNQNVLGENGALDGFSVTSTSSYVRSAEVGSGDGCFDQEKSSNDDLADAQQAQDFGSGNCYFFGTSSIENDFFKKLSKIANDETIVYNLLTVYMVPEWLSKADILDDSGAKYTSCFTPFQLISSILYNLGSNLGVEDWYPLDYNNQRWSYDEACSDDCFAIADENVDGELSQIPESDISESEIYNSCVVSCEFKDEPYDSICYDGCIGSLSDQVDAYGCYDDPDLWGEENNNVVAEACSDLKSSYDGCIDNCEGYSSFIVPEYFNSFRSIKPVVFGVDRLHVGSYGLNHPAGDSGSSQYVFPALTFYVGSAGDSSGAGGCNNNEWKGVYKQKDEGSMKEVDINFDCKAWVGPENGDCSLCDVPISGGGLIFDKGGKLYPASYCNKFRCESLGSNCLFVGENYGSGHASCVSAPCDKDALTYVGPYMQALVDSGIDSTLDLGSSQGTDGYSVTDIPYGKTFSFGLETNNYGNCLFLREEDLGPLNDYFDVGDIQNIPYSPAYDPNNFYDVLRSYAFVETPVWDEKTCKDSFDCGSGYYCNSDGVCECNGEDQYCSEASDIYHNFTTSIPHGNTEDRYYVWCKDTCEHVTSVPYTISLTSGFEAPSDAPSIREIFPETGSLVAYDDSTEAVTVYVDRESTCKYSSNIEDSYESMGVTGTCMGESYGYFTCDFNVPLEDGTTTLYFLCQDTYGNTMDTDHAEQWTVSKTEDLEITQTAPSGILYYNDIYLQVNTAKGGDNGNAVCTFQEDSYVYAQDMRVTGGSSHEQSQTSLDKGDYSYAIVCRDEIGNSAETTIAFTVDRDESASSVNSIYYLGSSLYVITNEATTCQWDNEDFSYGGGINLAGTASTDHSMTISDFTLKYYIVCIDAYANEMEPIIIDFRYLLS